MRLGALSQEQLNHQFEAFRNGDATDRAELLLRHAIVVGCGLALWFATQQLVMLLWSATYVACNTVYVRFLRQRNAPIQPRHLGLALLGSTTVAAIYCAMVIYVSFLENGTYLLLSVCGCVGLALHCLSRNSTMGLSAKVDLLATILTATAVFSIAALNAPRLGVSISILVGGTCVVGYFWQSFQQIIADREALDQKLRAEAQSQKLRALGQLTGGIAHDFNNILTVVKGNIELAQLGMRDPQNAEYLSEAKTAANRGADLIRQLLAYVRKSNLTYSDVELHGLMNRVQAMLSRTLPANVRLSIDTDEAHVVIKGDAAMLETAVLNLVMNAGDAIGRAQGHIHIKVSKDERQNQVRIVVSDDGPGMDATTLEKAAEPFFTTKDVGQGSGLGLSMVKGFLEQSGGALMLQNKDTGGLQATMYLPMSHRATPSAQRPVAAAAE